MTIEFGKIPVRQLRRWAFCSYMVTEGIIDDDNNISELISVGSSKEIHVSYLIDRNDSKGMEFCEIGEARDGLSAEIVYCKQIDYENAADPRVLLELLKWCFQTLPAENWIFTLYGHGAGFKPFGSENKHFGLDAHTSRLGGRNASLSIPLLKKALTKAGVSGSHKFRIFGFDACLMNLAEIAFQFRDCAEMLISSQAVEPGTGWCYDELIRHAVDTDDPEIISKMIIRDFIRHHKVDPETRDDAKDQLTLSAVNTSNIQNVIDSADRLGEFLADRIDYYKLAIRTIRSKVQCFKHEGVDFGHIDLLHFCELLSEKADEPQLSRLVKNTRDAVLKAVVCSLSSGKCVENANGLSIWFPQGDNFTKYGEFYNSLDCNLGVTFGWTTFLKKYCNITDWT